MNNNAKIWESIINKLKENNNYDANDIDRWLSKVYILNIKNKVITLIAPNRYYQKYINENFLSTITKIFDEIYSNASGDLEVKLLLKENLDEKIISPENKIITVKEENNPFENLSLPLDKNYTFENFIVGNSNKFAYAACISIAEKYDKKKNPIYIYGDVGLGKTHLMQAVGNKVRVDNPYTQVLYITGNYFMNKFIYAMRNSIADDLLEKYKNVDLFLFDDIEIIAGKDATMKVFFQLFELLYNHNKQILLTSNILPKNIEKMDPRLASRFSGGLTVEIINPSVEEKMAIIISQFKNLNKNINSDIIEFIAENIRTTSTRDLIGLIITLSTKADLLNEEINVDFILNNYKDYFYDKNRVLNSEEILDEVSKLYGIKIQDLKSKSRIASITTPRNIAMYLIYHHTQSSYEYIGNLFNRDHSTVISSVKKISNLLENDEYLKKIVNKIKDNLKFEDN